MNELCDEVKLFQFQAEEILEDLKESYEVCWKMQMTRRCAQMLLKYESVLIIQLYETGILDSKESEDKELLKSKSCPLLFDYLNDASKERWEAVKKGKPHWT